MAGVSTKTVSRVINNEANVAADTAERVKQAVAKLNYVPNSAARSLSRGRAMAIALVAGGRWCVGGVGSRVSGARRRVGWFVRSAARSLSRGRAMAIAMVAGWSVNTAYSSMLIDNMLQRHHAQRSQPHALSE